MRLPIQIAALHAVEEVLVRVRLPFILIRVAHPGQVRHDENPVERQREIGMSPHPTDIGVIEPGAPLRAGKAAPVVDRHRMIGDNELGR